MEREWRWHAELVDADVRLRRWGVVGTPVLVFPPKSGDALEIERGGILESLHLLIDDRRIKVYSLDDIAGCAWNDTSDPLGAAAVHNRFNEVVIDDVIPIIRQDCHSPDIEVLMVGIGFGAIHAITMMCRIPQAVLGSVVLSGTFDISTMLDGRWSDDVYFVSPLEFIGGMDDGEHLDRIRRRFALLASGTGTGEAPGESWWLADVLGRRQIPNRVDAWPGWAHGWATWRNMLPGYVHELVP